MNLQVIVSGDGWVLDKHGKLLAEAFGGDLLTEPESMPPDGITYLMNYAQIRKITQIPRCGKLVSMLTHFEQSLAGLWEQACIRSDALVPMSDGAMAHMPIDKHGKTKVIPLPVPDYITKRRPRIGIAGIRNPQNEHRKGWDLVDRLRSDHPEWEIVSTGGNLTEPEMLAWYRSLDVYLCPSRYEGGPMGVLEAAAMGVPIVAPSSVGWCDDVAMSYNGITYTAGDYSGMVDAIDRTWSYPSMANSMADYIEAHRKLFASLQ